MPSGHLSSPRTGASPRTAALPRRLAPITSTITTAQGRYVDAGGVRREGHTRVADYRSAESAVVALQQVSTTLSAEGTGVH